MSVSSALTSWNSLEQAALNCAVFRFFRPNCRLSRLFLQPRQWHGSWQGRGKETYHSGRSVANEIRECSHMRYIAFTCPICQCFGADFMELAIRFLLSDARLPYRQAPCKSWKCCGTRCCYVARILHLSFTPNLHPGISRDTIVLSHLCLHHPRRR